ncbi:MAG: hypothetical protein ACFFFT_00340 [Candidatus Thorarchaeota archaeon]
MNGSKFTVKTQHIEDNIKITINFNLPLSKQKKERFEALFLTKRDLYEEKLARYKGAIERFISNRRELTQLLDKSETAYKRVPFEGSSKRSLNESLKKEFITMQWREYNAFFVKNPRFREIVTQIVISHLEHKYSLKIRNLHEYSLKDDLLLLIRDKKHILKYLKEKENNLKKELITKIKGWEETQAFFPSIFRNRTILFDQNSVVIECNVKTFYKHIFEYYIDYYNIKYQLKEPIVISKDMSYVSDMFHPFLISNLIKLLKEQNSELLAYCNLPFTYREENEKFLFRFNFEEVIKGICREFSEEPESWKRPIKSKSSKEKLLQKVKISVPIVAIIIIVGVITALFITIPIIKVGKYDSVKIDYMVWESDEEETYDQFNPILDAIVWVTMIPITENDSTGLMLGLFNNLLGKKIDYDSGLIWLNKCIDQNRDGIDDITGQPALTYGNSTDLYFNTCLMIRFKVLDIEKYTPSSSSDSDIALVILGLIIISVGGVLLSILGIFYGYRYWQGRPERPKLVSKEPLTKNMKMFKYGLLVVLLSIVTIITISVINVVTPFSGILFANQYNSFVLPVVIGFIIGICVLSTAIYFVLFGFIYRTFQKKKDKTLLKSL